LQAALQLTTAETPGMFYMLTNVQNSNVVPLQQCTDNRKDELRLGLRQII